jgi:hypothetical protein
VGVDWPFYNTFPFNFFEVSIQTGNRNHNSRYYKLPIVTEYKFHHNVCSSGICLCRKSSIRYYPYIIFHPAWLNLLFSVCSMYVPVSILAFVMAFLTSRTELLIESQTIWVFPISKRGKCTWNTCYWEHYQYPPNCTKDNWACSTK